MEDSGILVHPYTRLKRSASCPLPGISGKDELAEEEEEVKVIEQIRDVFSERNRDSVDDSDIGNSKVLEMEDEKADDEDCPYPAFNQKAFFYFEQTTRPRNWCIQLITWPYPFCL